MGEYFCPDHLANKGDTQTRWIDEILNFITNRKYSLWYVWVSKIHLHINYVEMKKMYVMFVLVLITAIVACKKDKEEDDNGGGNGGGSNATTYFLKLSSQSGYFADNPFNYTTTDGEYIAASWFDQNNTSRLRMSHFDNGTKDFLLYFEGANTAGTKTIVDDPVNLYSNLVFTVPNEVLFIIDFPAQSPVNITKFGTVNGTVEGNITGNFLHHKTNLATNEQTEYTNHFTAEFKVKRK